jgi:hypothetical protein
MPAGALVTVPLPVPAFTTVSEKVAGGKRLKVAVQEVLALSETVPVVQPVPDQPAKVESAAGLAVITTEVPLLYVAEQVVPQLIPAGALVTVPLPVPAFTTVSETVGTFTVAVPDTLMSKGFSSASLEANLTTPV